MMPLEPDSGFKSLAGKFISIRKAGPADSRSIDICFARQAAWDYQQLPGHLKGKALGVLLQEQKDLSPDTPGRDCYFVVGQTGAGPAVLGLCRAATDKSDPCQVKVRFYLPARLRSGVWLSEMLSMLVEYFFLERNKNKVRIFSDVRDKEFNNHLISGGFFQEGCLRENCLKSGRWYDEYVFSLLRREWSGFFPAF